MSWRDLVNQLDASVDSEWSELIRFLPWVVGSYDDGAPDTSRPAKNAQAILRLDADVVGPGGGPMERLGQTFGSRKVTEPVRLSVDGDAITAVRLRVGDRIRAMERIGTEDEWFEVKWLGNDAAGRLDCHLARLGKP